MDTFALRIDGSTQSRAQLDEATVERYREDMALGLWDFGSASDPAVAFYDGVDYWLAGGFHRLEAATRAGMLDEFSAGLEIRQGTLRDAILYSTGANATHGLQRSAEDKRRVVTRLLDDAEWSQWSDREIARRCHVDHRFVGRLREKLTGDIPSERTYTTKHGTIAIMDTSAIGKPAAKTAARDAPRTEWSLPENTGSGGAVAELRGLAPPDAGAILTPEPVGELRVDLSLPGAQVTHAPSSDGFCTYKMLKHYLDIRRPPLPSQSGVQAMTPEQLATIRRLAEQQRAWIAGLQEKIEAGSGQ